MFGLLTSMQVFLTSWMMYLTGTETVSSGLDVELMREIMSIVVEAIKMILGLFTVYPLNLFLIIGLIYMGAKFIPLLKNVAKKS